MSKVTVTPTIDDDVYRVVEYEVFHPELEPVLPPIICQTPEDAQRILDRLLQVLPPDRAALPEDQVTWQIREVVLNHRPIPAWSDIETSITVDEGRRLAAQHGRKQLVILAVGDKTGLNVVTVGSTKNNAELAHAWAQYLLKAMGYDVQDREYSEDRRQEHPEVPSQAAGAEDQKTVGS